MAEQCQEDGSEGDWSDGENGDLDHACYQEASEDPEDGGEWWQREGMEDMEGMEGMEATPPRMRGFPPRGFAPASPDLGRLNLDLDLESLIGFRLPGRSHLTLTLTLTLTLIAGFDAEREIWEIMSNNSRPRDTATYPTLILTLTLLEGTRHQ